MISAFDSFNVKSFNVLLPYFTGKACISVFVSPGPVLSGLSEVSVLEQVSSPCE